LGRPFFAVLEGEGMSLILTVFYEDPFWVGLFTISEGATARYCRVVFGKEPSDREIYEFVQRNYRNLHFSESLPAAPAVPSIKNPKRRQREAGRNLQQRTGEKKSYQLIKETLKQGQKAVRKADRKQLQEEQEAHILQVKQTKRKEKRRGH
jgi:hypothetical protein